MHEDDETRFPRITLWQFLIGILKTVVWFEMWPLYRWGDLQSSHDKKRADDSGKAQPSDRQANP
jgi:hypothetical protein